MPDARTQKRQSWRIAYREIEQCAVELGTVVGPELLKAEELMARKDWLRDHE